MTSENPRKYESPSTMGLWITFRQRLIEQLCLNMRPSLKPRFWKDKKYWGPKFSRESRGVANLFKAIEPLDADDPVVQATILAVIMDRNIKSLTAKKTVARVSGWIKTAYRQRLETHQELARLAPTQKSNLNEYQRNNSNIVTSKAETRLTKLRRLEEHGKKES